MENKDQPAFPIVLQEGLPKDCHIDIGLTKREYFAGLAMNGIIANNWKGYAEKNPECEMLAKTSVNYADALLDQLNKEV